MRKQCKSGNSSLHCYVYLYFPSCQLYFQNLNLALLEKCPYWELFQSLFSPIRTECGPEQLRIRTLFKQCNSFCQTFSYRRRGYNNPDVYHLEHGFVAREIRVHIHTNRQAFKHKINCFFLGFKAANFYQGKSVICTIFASKQLKQTQLRIGFLRLASFYQEHIFIKKTLFIFKILCHYLLSGFEFLDHAWIRKQVL